MKELRDFSLIFLHSWNYEVVILYFLYLRFGNRIPVYECIYSVYFSLIYEVTQLRIILHNINDF